MGFKNYHFLASKQAMKGPWTLDTNMTCKGQSQVFYVKFVCKLECFCNIIGQEIDLSIIHKLEEYEQIIKWQKIDTVTVKKYSRFTNKKYI